MSKSMEELVKGDFIEDVEELVKEAVWTTIDLSIPKEELQLTITKSIVASLKLTHPDDLHFYVLEQLLLTENANHLTNEHKVWRRVLNHINHETD